jgi:hypothetical protein
MAVRASFGRLRRGVESGVVVRVDYGEVLRDDVVAVVDGWAREVVDERWGLDAAKFAEAGHLAGTSFLYVDAPTVRLRIIRTWLDTLVEELGRLRGIDAVVTIVGPGQRIRLALDARGVALALGMWRPLGLAVPPMPTAVMERTLDWVFERSRPVALRALNAEFGVESEDEARRAVRALCGVAAGVSLLAETDDGIVYANLERDFAPSIVVGRSGRDVTDALGERADELRVLARSFAEEIVYAVIQPRLTLHALNAGSLFANQPEVSENSQVLLGDRIDRYTLDAQWWQLLAEGHAQRLADRSFLVPVARERYEATFGDVEDWLPGSDRYTEVVETARAALAPLWERPPLPPLPGSTPPST